MVNGASGVRAAADGGPNSDRIGGGIRPAGGGGIVAGRAGDEGARPPGGGGGGGMAEATAVGSVIVVPQRGHACWPGCRSAWQFGQLTRPAYSSSGACQRG